MLPLLAGSLGAIYSAGKTFDNARYWHDYYKNTGKRPRYPFQSGGMDWMKFGAFGLGGSSVYNPYWATKPADYYATFSKRLKRF